MIHFKVQKNINQPFYTGKFIEWDDSDYSWDCDELWGHMYTYSNNPKSDIIIFKVKGR